MKSGLALQIGPLPHDLADLLKICADIYRRAKIKPDKTCSKGPPGKNQARRTAEAAALAFWRLTGKRPTVTTNPVTNKRGGLFLKFLREVFAVIGLEASVDVQA